MGLLGTFAQRQVAILRGGCSRAEEPGFRTILAGLESVTNSSGRLGS